MGLDYMLRSWATDGRKSKAKKKTCIFILVISLPLVPGACIAVVADF